MTLGSGAACVKAASHSSTATHRMRSVRTFVGWAKPADANASGGVPTIARPDSLKEWWARREARLCPPYGLRLMPAALLHRGKLFGAGRALMGRLPGFVGHAVDG